MNAILLLLGCAPALAATLAPERLAQGGPISLGTGSAQVALLVPPAAAGRRVALVLSELAAPVPPGVLYRVSVNGRAVGYVNFLNAANGGPASFTFDVSGDVAAGGRVALDIAPQGAPAANADAVVGKIALLAY